MTASKYFAREATGLIRNISGTDAMMINLVGIGVLYALFNNIFDAELFAGANLFYTTILALLFCLPYAGLYVLMSVAMPRSGGDYVWVSRTLNPALGFLCNFYLTLIILSFSGITTGWGFSYAFAPMFQGIYQITGNAQYLGLATFFSNNTYAFISSAVVSAFYGYLIYRGTRLFVVTQWVAGIASIVGAVVFTAVLFSTNPADVVRNFNALAPLTYNKVFSLAANNGISTNFTLTGTLFGSVFATQTLIAFMYSAYFAGEVKGVSRSQIIAQYGSLILAGLLQILMVGGLYYAFGPEFISAISQLALGSKYPLAMYPTGQYLIAFVTTNIPVIVIVNVAFALMTWAACGAYIFTATRNIFAWSFDRVFPSRMTAVSQKYSTPYLVILLATIISIVYAYLNYFTTALTVTLTYSSLGWWVGVFIVAIAGIAFPFRRKEIFEISPRLVKMKIGSVPVLSILGVILAAVSVFIAYSVISPAYVGVLNTTYVVAVVALLLLGLVIYYASYFYNKSKGIMMEQAYRQIPPE